MRPRRSNHVLAAVAAMVLACGAGPAPAADGGFPELSAGTGTTSGDVYRAGLTPHVTGQVDGDVAVAGGDVRIASRIAGDLLAAGLSVDLAGEVQDDARVAGGTVTIEGQIGDHLMVAGNTIELRPGSEVGGDVRASGDRVVLHGRVQGPVEVSADRVQIRGDLRRDVRITAEHVEVGPDARIAGTLRYRADAPATVADGARIRGELLFERNAPRRGEATTDAPSARGVTTLVLWVVSTLVAAAVLSGLFPGFVRASERTARARPWQSFGVGLLTLAAVPVVVILLMALVVTLPLGVALMALAPVAVLVGYLLFAFVATERVMRLIGADPARMSARLLGLVGILLVLAGVQRLPVVGNWVLAAVIVFGTGAGLVALMEYRRQGEVAS